MKASVQRHSHHQNCLRQTEYLFPPFLRPPHPSTGFQCPPSPYSLSYSILSSAQVQETVSYGPPEFTKSVFWHYLRPVAVHYLLPVAGHYLLLLAGHYLLLVAKHYCFPVVGLGTTFSWSLETIFSQ